MEDYLKRTQHFHHLWQPPSDKLTHIQKIVLLYKDVVEKEEEQKRQQQLVTLHSQYRSTSFESKGFNNAEFSGD